MLPFSERAVLTDPAAVSGHLAIFGVPTVAFQPLQRCRPAVKYLTRLNRIYFRSGPLVALSTLSPIRYLLRPKTRFPVRRLHLFSGREFHPLEAPGLSWRTIVHEQIHQDRTSYSALRDSTWSRKLLPFSSRESTASPARAAHWPTVVA